MSTENMVKQGQIGVQAQSVWGGLVSGSMSGMAYNAETVPTFDNAGSLEAREMLGASSVTSESGRSFFDGKGELKTISFESYLYRAQMDVHLSAALQASTVVVPGIGEYRPADDVVDFQASEGSTYNVVKKWANGDSVLLQNAIVSQLNFNLDNTASGLGHVMTMDGSWTGTKVTPSYTATINTPDISTLIGDAGEKWYLNWNDGTTTYTDHCFYNWSMSIDNQIEGTCKGAGEFRNYRIRPVLTVNFTIPWSDANDSTLDNYVAGTKMSFGLRNYAGVGNPTSPGDFMFAADEMILTSTPDADQNGYEALNIQAEILRPDAGWNAVIKRWN